MTTLPDLAAYDRFSVDTETTGVDWHARPIGISIATPDGQSWYLRWGHEGGGNNTSLGAIGPWIREQLLARPLQKKIFFNFPFDGRMLTKAGLTLPVHVPGLIDAGTMAALLNEEEPSYSLDRLAQKYLKKEKAGQLLDEWCASQFGGRPNRSAQAENYWRAPGDLVDEYARFDAQLTLELHDYFLPLIGLQGLSGILETETALLPIVLNMQLYGTRVDVTGAEQVNRDLLQQLEELKHKWMDLAPRETWPAQVSGIADWTLPSSDWAEAVFTHHGLPPVLRTEKGNPSITKDWLESLAEDYEAADVLQQVRQVSKLSGTFVKSYILDAVDEHGLIHPEFHPMPVEYKPGKKYGTVSGRLSSWVNNVPGDRRPKVGRLIRSLFVPYYTGGAWVKADYSQIEYRFLGHYAGGSIAAAYNAPPVPGVCPACGKEHEDVDFHCLLTILINKPDRCPRVRTKNVNFAKVYGAGAEKAAATAGITVEEWKEVLSIYDQKVPEISQIYRLADQRAAKRGFIVTWGGRRCRFKSRAEALKLGWKVHPKELFCGTYKALNRLLQGSAADLQKKSMVRVAGPGGLIDWDQTLLHITEHDEMDFTVPRDAVADFTAQLHRKMEEWSAADGVTTPTVPIRAEIRDGSSWGDLIKG